MYPDRDTLSNVPRSGYIIARDQSMDEKMLEIVISLDFHLTKQGLPLVNSW